MQHADRGTQEVRGDGLRIGLVRCRFNDALTSALQQACETELTRLGARVVAREEVPGALEAPLALQALARQGQVDALVVLGCVIRGETYHFELVANESGAGVTRVGLDHHLPIANVILTVENEAQAWARVEKGREAAQVAVEMARLVERLAPHQNGESL
ncbi:6,7-dimethyl-8-ribityllumazine synthase [Inhella gelatinilytica]|uniref:6,7-dimethyl-8-ribityllumazine synthase n=1 Tax=Inhella gelatinilytica TaxID=2795030 RepID=A0A931IUF6_9BURK|nr:6,7-dimethyl-8-ribityllumazine synthase [Inhella gelatinilytica]MBH9552982.1 6,7-dimethyl-8-ribityllumazine synthase [Inhella gelatinilytica]